MSLLHRKAIGLPREINIILLFCSLWKSHSCPKLTASLRLPLCDLLVANSMSPYDMNNDAET